MAKDYVTEAQYLVVERRNELAEDLIKSGELMRKDKNCEIDMSKMLGYLRDMIDLYIDLQESVDDMKLLAE